MSSTRAPAGEPRSRRTRILLIVVAVVVILPVAVAAWVGVRGLLARGELESAVPLASRMQEQIVAGDPEAAQQTYVEFADHASSAAALTSDPIWRGVEWLPVVGPNLTAVREVAGVVDDVSRDAVAPLISLAGEIDATDFKPVDGAIDVDPLVAAQTDVAEADAALQAAADRVSRVDTSSTIGAVTSATAELRGVVTEASATVDVIDRAVRLLPAVLGADGPRDYLLLFANSAEVRATGGNPGSLAVLRTDGGRIELTQQASTANFPQYPEPVVELPAETLALYGEATGRFMQSVNLTPYFPLTAELAREMWRIEFGTEVDGVISIDPVTLAYLLQATGPVTLPTGDVLTAENAVQTLLVDAYTRYPEPAAQDAFFAGAAATVFATVASGAFEPSALISALAQAGDERRVYVWSADAGEQDILAATTLQGTLPTSTDDTVRFGAYLNDATGSKMGSYLDVDFGLGQATCREDGRPVHRVEVTLENTAPADAATSLPGYVTGAGDYGVPPGNINTVVSVYGAPGMENMGVTRDDESIPFQPAFDREHPVSLLEIELAPGESTILHFDWLGEAPFDGETVIESTPVIHLPETSNIGIEC
ncbi:DUF4012 domain-containing protein [Marisediminicola sp. LYQ85]|uniref:DUF4012 domain-containing protein n=1 Tax=Marisediminicola sp. LYQ85 TaxID=3391062 RepID=UPI003982D9F4